MSTTNRRDFIKNGMIGTAGVSLGALGFSAKSYAAIKGANDRVNIGVIGIRNQGTVHLNGWCSLKDSHNVQVRTLCDTDEALFGAGVKLVEEKGGTKPATNWDLRAVLEDKDIDAVSIVVPNHWHALATVWALQAGKHVYVEKPASHNIWEGRKMVEAWRKYNLRVQCGLNNRSAKNVREAITFLHSGGIGELYMARALCFKARDSYGAAKEGQPPATFHYDRWLGPAPLRPYSEKRSHYNWHWYWDTGNGDTGNTGPHQLDIARWGMRKNEHPVAVYSTGGIFGFTEDVGKTPGKRVYGDVEAYGHDKTTQETPNTQTAAYTYADGKIISSRWKRAAATRTTRAARARRSATFSTAAKAGSKSPAARGRRFGAAKKSPSRSRRTTSASALPIGRTSWRPCVPAKTTACTATSTRATSRPRSATLRTFPTASAVR
jgi:predicted dehydrogenase